MTHIIKQFEEMSPEMHWDTIKKISDNLLEYTLEEAQALLDSPEHASTVQLEEIITNFEAFSVIVKILEKVKRHPT